MAAKRVGAVRRNHNRLGQAADLDFLDLCDLLAVDAKDRNTAIAVVIPGIFIVGPTVNGSDCYIALGSEGKPLWCVTDHNSVNDARRLRFKIDDSAAKHPTIC